MEWEELLLGDADWIFLGETVLRTIIMFLIILLSLRLLGKRGIKQLSVFELGVIIGLGSAAGDPMFYKDVGLLPSLLVFIMVVLLYRLITFFISRSQHFEKFVEGTPTCIIKDGLFIVENFSKEPLALDELFSQLRLHAISHLGQVEQAIIETNGEVSIYFYTPEDTRHGLPILPDLPDTGSQAITEGGLYACTFCGRPEQHTPKQLKPCPSCNHDKWRKASNKQRVS